MSAMAGEEREGSGARGRKKATEAPTQTVGVEMGLCKCRNVTNLYCFVHRQHVCENCCEETHNEACRGAARLTAARD